MATETRTRYRSSVSGTSVKKATTGQRPKITIIDKVKTTGRKKPTVRAATPTTTRRGTRR